MSNFLKQKQIQILIIVVLTVLAYSNIFQNKLVLDDNSFITDWEQVRSFKNLPDLLTGNVPPVHKGVYRPIRSVLYLVYYHLFGTNPIGYHLHSLVVHLASTILVYLISIRLIRHIGQISKLSLTPFFTALFFGLHPIHTEAITYIAASMEMTGVVFFLASFYFYLKTRDYSSISSEARGRSKSVISSRIRSNNIISVASAFLAFFTYEMTVTLPILIVLYELTLHHPRFSIFKSLPSTIHLLLSRTWPYFVLPASFFLLRIAVLKIPVSRGEYLSYSFYHTQLVMLKVYVIYILRLLFPLSLSYITDLAPGFESFTTHYSNLQSIRSLSLFDPEILISLGILGGLGLSGVYFWKKQPLISFCIFWFFISLLPVSYIFPQGIAISEKYTYIGSVGFCLLLAILFEAGARTKIIYTSHYVRRIFSGFCFILLIFSYLSLTYSRNLDWRDPVTFWTKVAKQHPKSHLAQYNLGILYSSQKEFPMAVTAYEKAIENEPRFFEARFNLGNILLSSGNASSAAELYRSALELNPSFSQAQENLNVALEEMESIKQERVKYSYLGVSLTYPKNWRREISSGLNLSKDNFKISLSVFNKPQNQSVEEYISSQKTSLGSLVNQGLAQIPNADISYVKVWSSEGSQTLQFFLFKNDKVVEVRVSPASTQRGEPANSPKMREFNKILGSLKYE